MKKAEKEFLMSVYFAAQHAAFLETLNAELDDAEVCDEISRRKEALPLAWNGSAWNAVTFVENLTEKFPQDGFNDETLKAFREKAKKLAQEKFNFLTSDAHARQLARDAETKMFR